MTALQVAAAKIKFRKNFKFETSREKLAFESQQVACFIISHSWFTQSQSVAVFCSRNHMELDTTPIIDAAFLAGKSCFVPRCMPNSMMDMVQIFSIQDLNSLPLNKMVTISNSDILSIFYSNAQSLILSMMDRVSPNRCLRKAMLKKYLGKWLRAIKST